MSNKLEARWNTEAAAEHTDRVGRTPAGRADEISALKQLLQAPPSLTRFAALATCGPRPFRAFTIGAPINEPPAPSSPSRTTGPGSGRRKEIQ